MQTTYQQDLSVALAGMIADSDVAFITSYPASEAIPYGRLVVIDAGGLTCSLPKTAGAMPTSGTGSPLGVSVYDSAANPGGWQIGDMVPVLRSGKIWVDFSGTTASDNVVLNVKNSSTTATDRGKFTDAATSTTAGSEVSAFPRAVAKELNGALVKIDISLP